MPLSNHWGNPQWPSRNYIYQRSPTPLFLTESLPAYHSLRFPICQYANLSDQFQSLKLFIKLLQAMDSQGNKNFSCIVSRRKSHSRHHRTNKEQMMHKVQRLYTENRINKSLKKFNEDSSPHYRYAHHPSTYKSKQKLFEQNMLIKSINNELKRQVNILRVEKENQKKKSKNYTIKLNREFRKDFYYSNSSQRMESSDNKYLLAGIRTKYEQLKDSYQILTIKYEELKKNSAVQRLNEDKIYADALQLENQRLVRRVQMLQGQKSQNEAQREQAFKADFEDTVHRLKIKNYELKTKIKKFKKQHKENVKVVQFLQQNLLNQGTQIHKATVKMKELKRQNQELGRQLIELQHKVEDKRGNVQQKTHQIEQLYERKALKERQTFNNVLKEKDQLIKKLQKQIASLTTMLGYWKPMESSVEEAESFDKENSLNPELLGDSQKPESSRGAKGFELFRKQSDQGQYIEEPKGSLRTSAARHSPNGIKMRKIDQQCISHLSEYLTYRLIGRRISHDQFQDYLQSQCSSSQSSYISHKSLQQIFQNQPFMLGQTQADNLARYVVEDECCYINDDPSNAFVYYDPENQIAKSIAQSIMKAFIGHYQLPDEDQCQQRWNELSERYGDKLKAALSSISPNGYVALQKWNHLMVGMVTEQVQQNVKNWLIGRMLINSENLQQLNYRIVLQEPV